MLLYQVSFWNGDEVYPDGEEVLVVADSDSNAETNARSKAEHPDWIVSNIQIVTEIDGYSIRLVKKEATMELTPEHQKKLESMLEADKNSPRLIEWNDETMKEFIQRCEKVYGKTTEQHMLDHEANELEGSPEMRQWYRFGRELKEKGE